MNKRYIILVMILILVISSLVGCAKIHIYTGDGIKVFQEDIKLEYDNIDKVQVRRSDIEIYITYILLDTASDEDIKKLYKITEEYVNKDKFIEAISKEDKVDGKSFHRATLIIKNPNNKNKKYYNEKIYGLNVE